MPEDAVQRIGVQPPLWHPQRTGVAPVPAAKLQSDPEEPSRLVSQSSDERCAARRCARLGEGAEPAGVHRIHLDAAQRARRERAAEAELGAGRARQRQVLEQEPRVVTDELDAGEQGRVERGRLIHVGDREATQRERLARIAEAARDGVHHQAAPAAVVDVQILDHGVAQRTLEPGAVLQERRSGRVPGALDAHAAEREAVDPWADVEADLSRDVRRDRVLDQHVRVGVVVALEAVAAAEAADQVDRAGRMARQVADRSAVHAPQADAGRESLIDDVVLPAEVPDHVARRVGVLRARVEPGVPAAPQRIPDRLEVAEHGAAAEGEQVDARLPPAPRRVAVAAGVLDHVAQELVAGRVRGVEPGVHGVVHVRVADAAVVRTPEVHAHALVVRKRVGRVAGRRGAVDLAVLDPDRIVADRVVVVGDDGVVPAGRERGGAEDRRTDPRARERGVARELEERVRAAGAGIGRRRQEGARHHLDQLRAGVGECVHGVLQVVHLEHAVVVPIAHARVVGEAVAVAVDARVRRPAGVAAARAEAEPGGGPEDEQERGEGGGAQQHGELARARAYHAAVL